MKRYILITLIILIVSSMLSSQDLNFLQNAMVNAVVWQRTSVEYQALCHQAYNTARTRLEEDLKKNYGKPKAVIVDLDETVLDNSLFEAQMILDGLSYHEDFDAWIASAKCQAVPGALSFLNYADENGYKIFYLSNRRLRHLKGSLNNLKKLKFPQAEESQILLKNQSSNKGIRRQKVSKSYEIILLIGDNLIDFDDIFRMKNIKERFAEIDKVKDKFGQKFIILPNPIYGEWIKAVYGGTRNIPEKAKKTKLLNSLKYKK